jgi:hypothetical protein
VHNPAGARPISSRYGALMDSTTSLGGQKKRRFDSRRIAASQRTDWKSEICVAHHVPGAHQDVILSSTSGRRGASYELDESEHLDGSHEIQSGREQKEKNCGSDCQVEIKQVVSERCAINWHHHREIAGKSR